MPSVFGSKDYGMKACPNCKKLKIGELQSICKNCGYSAGSDRWYSLEGERAPIKRIDP